MRGNRVGHVVAEGVEVDLARGDVIEVAVAHVELDAVLAPVAARVERVGAAHLDVGAVPVHAVHLHLVGPHVRRVARGGVGEDEAVHVAHLELGIVLVSVANHAARGHELVVERLVALLRRDLDLGARPLEAADHRRLKERAGSGRAEVDLVEREPPAHLVVVAVEHGLRIALEELDELAALPAVVLLDQVIGHLVVAERHQRLDAVRPAAVEDPVIERQARLVGLQLLARGEDAAPRDGHAEHVETHLGEERDVLLVAVVEVDAVVVGVEPVGVNLDRDLTRGVHRAAEEVVVHGRTAPVHVPRALELVGRRRAAPVEALREGNRHDAPPFFSAVCWSQYGAATGQKVRYQPSG